MIQNIPVEGLYDESYCKIVEKMLNLREKQLSHGYEINRLGTGSYAYSLMDYILSPLRRVKKLRRYVIYFLKKYRLYLKKQKRVQISEIVNEVWTRDVVESSTLPYPVRRAEYPWAILNAKLEKNMKILDVGSGVSLFPVYLAHEGYEVISIDPDRILMENIAPRLSEFCNVKIKYETGDVTKLNFDDNSFDRIFCISVIEHLEEQYVNGKFENFHKDNLDVKAIAELLRVLKPGGLLVLTFDWNEDPKEHRSYKLDDIYERVLEPYKNNLVSDRKPVIDWETLKIKHLEAGKSFPPFNYINEGWAIGVILKK